MLSVQYTLYRYIFEIYFSESRQNFLKGKIVSKPLFPFPMPRRARLRSETLHELVFFKRTLIFSNPISSDVIIFNPRVNTALDVHYFCLIDISSDVIIFNPRVNTALDVHYFCLIDISFLSSEKQILQYPVHTFSSGATNSMRGAVHLSSLKDAVVVDIGGTSTDVGVLVNGFPREASTRVKVNT